ncbi:MAG: hypothetical protein DCC67_06495 [Planctomycetota bacterium]|nr:MAG: hypothetical protein DCC67_06495 [Planctomycetota bacterium]
MIALALFGAEAFAKDHFLIIGGGYSPAGNQLSIEANVIFLQDMLDASPSDRRSCDVYFADGDDEQPDVQYHDDDAAGNCPPARRLLAEVFGDSDAAKTRYRNHRVRNVRGRTDSELLARRFRELGRELSTGDRLIVFVTAHGSEAAPSDDYDYEDEEWTDSETEDSAEVPYNKFDTEIMLWDEDAVSASQFNRWLDRIGRDVAVVLVMGQCYAGGFSHAIFHQNNAELGLSPHARCGFFAQVHDRPAAGCTPGNDIEEYVYLFWSALAGRTRDGQPVTSADYDANGQVSLAEAHAYAMLAIATGDVPVRTSGAVLRRYSRLQGSPDQAPEADEADDNPLKSLLGAIGAPQDADGELKLRAATGPLAAFEKDARPDQAAVIRGLSEKLQLQPGATVESLRMKLRQLKNATAVAEAQAGVASATVDRTQTEAQDELCGKWPELRHPYSPVVAELTAERADEFVAQVRSMAAYEALCRAREKYNELLNAAAAAEAEQARAERLLQTIEEIALAENLPKVAPAEVVARYEQILQLESQPLN